MLEKIVSGGQTGIDRAALDAARDAGLEAGGWIPAGRRAEDGRIPDRYEGLVECASAAYPARTKLNVRDSDATLILSLGEPTGGTALTVREAERLGRPHLVIDLGAAPIEAAADEIGTWLSGVRPRILNVAGPRAGQAESAAAIALALLRRVFHAHRMSAERVSPTSP